jgi:hypothetical protein
MKAKQLICAGALGLGLLAGPVYATTCSRIDVPWIDAQNTSPTGINNAGQIVGGLRVFRLHLARIPAVRGENTRGLRDGTAKGRRSVESITLRTLSAMTI